MTDDTLSLALLDVRRAYRLIHAYQRRVCDILAALDTTAAHNQLAFHGWYATEFDEPVRKGKRFFGTGQWTWPMLPMYDVTCSWRSDSTQRKRPRLDVRVRADNGFATSGEEPVPADFEPAQACASILSIRMMRSKGPGVNWDHVDSRLDERAPDADASCVLDIGKAQVWATCLDLDLAKLAAPDALDRLVLRPVNSWAQNTPE